MGIFDDAEAAWFDERRVGDSKGKFGERVLNSGCLVADGDSRRMGERRGDLIKSIISVVDLVNDNCGKTGLCASTRPASFNDRSSDSLPAGLGPAASTLHASEHLWQDEFSPQPSFCQTPHFSSHSILRVLGSPQSLQYVVVVIHILYVFGKFSGIKNLRSETFLRLECLVFFLTVLGLYSFQG